jgi:predicted Zn-dependent protease
MTWAQEAWRRPARFARPEITTDEGGWWAMIDREETNLRRSPFVVSDAALSKYVNNIACKLAGDHCPDIRVHLVHKPSFNASMAPNGMMQIWTGLLLRMENEAQLAAVIGHELGHHLQRHAIDRIRDVRTRAAFMQLLSAFGLVGAVGQLIIAATAQAYSRDQEREADSISISLMAEAGYDTQQASRVWENMLLELNTRPTGDPAARFTLFTTHPPSEERRTTLAQLATSRPGGAVHDAAWRDNTAAHRAQWIQEEIQRGQHDESIALFTRMIKQEPGRADILFARGETYRLRAGENDLDSALADYRAAVGAGSEPPATHRGLGLVHKVRGQPAESKASFQRYLELLPGAPDAPMIKSYMEDAGV